MSSTRMAWTEQEEDKLAKIFLKHDNTDLGIMFDRTTGAIAAKLTGMGLLAEMTDKQGEERRKLASRNGARRRWATGGGGHGTRANLKEKTVTLVVGPPKKERKPKHLNGDALAGVQEIIEAAIDTARDQEHDRIVKQLREMVEAL